MSTHVPLLSTLTSKRPRFDYTYEVAEATCKRVEGMPPPSGFCKGLIREDSKFEDLILNYRPHWPDVPVTLYYPVFAKFVEQLSIIEITDQDCKSVMKLLDVMSTSYFLGRVKTRWEKVGDVYIVEPIYPGERMVYGP